MKNEMDELMCVLNALRNVDVWVVVSCVVCGVLVDGTVLGRWRLPRCVFVCVCVFLCRDVV